MSEYEIEMIVEIPRGDRNKYEIKDGKIYCDRVLHTPMNYSFNYGYFDNSLAGDGDPLDVVLHTASTFVPNTHIQCRIIGYLETSDEKGMDEKIIAVPAHSVDPQYSHINDISDLNELTLKNIEFFFDNYKKLEKGKKVTVGDFHGKEKALEIYKQSKATFENR